MTHQSISHEPCSPQRQKVLALYSLQRLTFDLFVGICLPLTFSVFYISDSDYLFLGEGAVYAGYFLAIVMLALTLWLFLRLVPYFLANILLVGAFLSAFIGLAVLPWSLFRLQTGEGIVGLVPFLMAYVFWRNSMEAFDAGEKRGDTRKWTSLLADLGLLIVLAAPAFAQICVSREIDRAMELVQSSDPDDVSQGVKSIQRFRFLDTYDKLVWLYDTAPDEFRRKQLAEMYRELTNNDITERLTVLKRRRD